MDAELPAGVDYVMTRHPKQFLGLRQWFFAAIAAAATTVTFVGFAPTYYLKGLFDAASASGGSSRARGSLHRLGCSYSWRNLLLSRPKGRLCIDGSVWSAFCW